MKPQDIICLLKLLTWGKTKWSYEILGESIGLSSMQCHRSINRAAKAGLYNKDTHKINRVGLLEFTIHGLKYIQPPVLNEEVKGTPTAHSAPIFFGHIDDNNPIVWPDNNGSKKGQSLLPIHECALYASAKDIKMYDALALIDAIRVGRVREVEFAKKKLKEIIINAA